MPLQQQWLSERGTENKEKWKSANVNVAHTCKEEWLEFPIILIAFRRSYRLHCETACSMDDTAQIEKRRVGILTSYT